MLKLNKLSKHFSKCVLNKANKLKLSLKTFSTSEEFHPLTTISPLDGRYSSQLTGLKQYYSEKGLMKYRTIVEVEWLRFLIKYVQRL